MRKRVAVFAGILTVIATTITLVGTASASQCRCTPPQAPSSCIQTANCAPVTIDW